MNQTEIERALVNEAARMGIDLSNKKTAVDLIAGRGPEGFKAEIEILDIDESTEEPAEAGDDSSEDADVNPSDSVFG